MADAIRHRGPDAGGAWADADAGVALGHRRLAIIDLSETGAQPMASPNGRYVVSFNGEIYNYQELRAQIDAPYRGTSDTEVMLAAFDKWGIEAGVAKLNGMFALAVWDRKERTLTLARDRFGEKPLYYAWSGNTFLFGSELRALRTHSGFQAEIDRGALTLMLRHGYIPEPYCIYRSVRKLPQAGLLTVRGPQVVEPKLYWNARTAAAASLSAPIAMRDDEAIESLDELLTDAVKMRMVSDVPLGAFLSGGIDSSLIVALMQKVSARPVKTFTIGFTEAGFDEAPHAKKVAQYLGCEHRELYVTPQEALAVVPLLPAIYDEPFADSSQIPTYLVSKLAREHVTVSLSGDGGDEFFGGYSRYREAESMWNKVGWMPAAARRSLSNVFSRVPRGEWERAFQGSRFTNPSGKAEKLATMLAFSTPDDFYGMFLSGWPDSANLVPGAEVPPTQLSRTEEWAVSSRFYERMMFLDLAMYLPADILVKVDRASMAVALESRVPLLDPRIADFSWTVPFEMKVRDGQGKWLLRRVLDKYVPRPLVERPKAGFGIPLHDWMRGPLRDWAEELLAPARLSRDGFVNPDPIRLRWKEHVTGTHNWAYSLWPVLMFQAWLDQDYLSA